MELSQAQRITVSHQFDCYCKKVLRGEFRDCMRESQRMANREIPFSELPAQVLERVFVVDEYATDTRCFNVIGYDIEVKDALIAEVLAALPMLKRNIVLLSYFLDMTDQDIGKGLNLQRSTVQYQRSSALKLLNKLLEGFHDEEI